MHNSPISKEFYNSITDVLVGKTTKKIELPESLVEAAKAAAEELKVLTEGAIVAETRRDIMRKHLKEGVGKCGCQLTPEMVVRFEEVVTEAEVPVKQPTQKAGLATPAEVKKKTQTPPTDTKTGFADSAASKMPTQKPALATPAEVKKDTNKPATKTMPKNNGLASTGKNPAKIGEDTDTNESNALVEIAEAMTAFVDELSESEIRILKNILSSR